ncbi:HGGxSTG domain-containing protein [Streptomyces sp. NPDC096057]|uniref:HGGxSTG domain-containing protein n=1 Tax=Streptomyces sp. NPDC096057 TaxID=3155543 RepID=UPI00332751C0
MTLESLGPPTGIRCTARRSNGEPCGNRPMRGQTVCRKHGGASPQAKSAAERRQLEAGARALLADLDVDPVGDPLAALLRLGGQAIAWQEAAAKLVNELADIRYRAANGTEQLRAEVALFERATDRACQVLATIAKLRIDERLTAVSERQAEAVIGAVEAALAAVGVTGERAVDARRAAARHLRLIDGVGA